MATVTAIPAPITMMSGSTVLPQKTITIPAATRVLTKYEVDTVMVTTTFSYLYVSFLLLSVWKELRVLTTFDLGLPSQLQWLLLPLCRPARDRVVHGDGRCEFVFV
jgi:hypothetical protein